MLFDLLLLASGLALVVKGADILVNGASSLARRLAVREIVIGLTIVAFGTSAPELIVNAFSSIAGKDELVLGNVIGSNIVNTLLILGIAGLIYPLVVQRGTVLKEIPFSLLAAAVFFVLANDGWLPWLDGVILLVLFAGFIVYNFGISRGGADENNSANGTSGDSVALSMPRTWIYIVGGLVGLFIGGKLVVDNTIDIAKILGVSDKLIGLTIVALGTSLPELATSVVAAYKKKSDLAVGNVVGSNIFNTLFILGISTVIHPVRFPAAFNFDLYIYAGGVLLLLTAMYTGKKGKLDRWESLVLLTGYILYLVLIILRQ